MNADLVSVQAEVARLHAQLVRYNLVAWTAGNVSARVPGHDLMVIKPSGVDYDEITADHMIVCDLDGTVVQGDLSPSSDTAAHAYVYRHLPTVGGIAHTHSPYACAWAARGEPIPCVLTAMADEFGVRFPSARSPSSAATTSAPASSQRWKAIAPRQCSCATTVSSPSAHQPGRR